MSYFRRPGVGSRPAPVLKSPREIELMRSAGRVVCRVLDRMSELVAPGISPEQLSEEADRVIADAGAEALFKGVRIPGTKFPFPSPLCVSVNDEVVHGLPRSEPLKDGDIVSIDCGVRLKGYCGDSARTFAVGGISSEAQKLLDVTQGALRCAIEEMRPGIRWSAIAEKMQRVVESSGFSVVRTLVGHGIGMEMHEEPKVPNYADRESRRSDFVLSPGLVLAVEPMVNIGSAEVVCRDPSGWAQVTEDGALSAHFEHTIAVVDGGVDVLTAKP